MQCQGRVICKALARGLLEQLAQPAHDLHLEAEGAADGRQPVEQAAGGRPGGLDHITEFQQFDPAAWLGHADEFLHHGGPQERAGMAATSRR